MRSQLIVATHNSHKTEEIRQIVGDYFDSVEDLKAFPDIPEPVEDGETFEENSAIKAFSASEHLSDAFILADDSGLEVDALDGAPGVYSARYSGPDATDASNREKLKQELRHEEDLESRTGRFRCVLTVVKNGEKLAVFSGACEGNIDFEERGEGGFGYDPLFIPNGFESTFAQLPPETKNQLSHRGKALEVFKKWLAEQTD